MNSSYLFDMSVETLSNKDLIERLNKMMVYDIPSNADRHYLVMKYQEALKANTHNLHLIIHDKERDLESQLYLKRQNEITSENNINDVLQDKTIKLNPNQIFDNNISNARICYTKLVLPMKHKKLIQSNKFNSLNKNCQNNNNNINLQLNSIHINNNNNSHNTSTTNIPSIRRSLLKAKYTPSMKHRYSLSNPRELTPIPEKAASLESISEHKISVQHKQINSISISNSNILLSHPISSITKEDKKLSSINILFIILPTILIIIIISYIIKPNHSLYKPVINFIKKNSSEFANSITNIMRSIRKNVGYNKYIFIPFIIGLILIGCNLYNKHKEKKLVSKIFTKIKSDLQGMVINDQGVNNESVFDNSFEIGISEKDIIKNYAKMYNINAKVFKQKYFPQIKQLCKKDENVKEFELVIDGRRTIMWQYFP